ncbi:JmjC domain-containing protein [Streptomyces sp. NPDC099088]|uniref:JmjC domain-containing protein n=1 Tax=Streptomyces sp. NPDC099088 TaxID=3366101 RepID=UPI00382CEF07
MKAEFLSAMVGDVSEFFSDHWLNSPRVYQAALAQPAELLPVSELVKTLTSSALRGPHVRLIKQGALVDRLKYLRTIRLTADHVPDVVEPDLVLGEFGAGATIVVDKLEDFALPVRGACMSLRRSLSMPVHSHAFITPPGETGFRAHHDPISGFIVQVHGAKRWKVFARTETSVSNRTYSIDDLGKPIIETTLHPGDVLYIPHGFPHVATAPEVMSVHVTFSCPAPTWADSLRPLIENILASAEFKNVPNHFASNSSSYHLGLQEHAAEFVKRLVQGVEDLDLRADESKEPAIANALEGLELISRGRPEQTLICKRQDMRIDSSVDGLDLLRIDDAVLKLPQRFRAALDLLLSQEYSLLSDLQEAIGATPATALVSRLAAYGAVVASNRASS